MKWLALLCAVTASANAQEVPLQRGVVVEPESVAVGDPFRVIIRVRAPRGALIEFPQGNDTTTRVEPLDRVRIVLGADTSVAEQTATYRLAAWDVGRLAIRFPDILVRVGTVERHLAVGRDLAVQVVSVLPADTTQRVPRPVRPVYEFGVPWWYWLIVGLAALVLGALLWWWWRRRAAAPAVRRDPFADAEREFERLDSLGLVAAGEPGQHVSLCADVLRTYLSLVLPAARVSLTTSELALVLRPEAAGQSSRVARALHDIDLVKFARLRIADTRAGELAAECRAIVRAVHEGQQAAAMPQAA